MKIIVGGRRSGKTFRMVQWFCEDHRNRVILVPDAQQRDFVIKEIIHFQPEMKMTTRAWVGNICTPMTLQTSRGRVIKEAYVDNFEMIIRAWLGYNIPITMTSTEEMDVEEI